MRPCVCLSQVKILFCFACAAFGLLTNLLADEFLSGIEWQKPKVVSPGATVGDPPSDAVILFDGNDLSQWRNADRWKIEEGVMVAGRGDIVSVGRVR